MPLYLHCACALEKPVKGILTAAILQIVAEELGLAQGQNNESVSNLQIDT